MKQQPTHLFICGVGRSGTTVLRTSLGTHPEIYYNGFENNVVQDIAEAAVKNCTMKSRKRAMVISQSEYDSQFRSLISSLIWPDQQLAKRPVHMAAINPTPDQLDYLMKLFPDSKFVGLIRNGIEVVSSRTEYRSFAADDFASHCKVWNRSAAVLEWGQKHPNRFRELRQEWFYAPKRLRRWMDEFSNWLGVEHSESPTDEILGTLIHPTSATLSFKGKQFSNAAVDNKQKYFLSKRDRWKDWTAEQRDVFEAHCGRNMEVLGYRILWRAAAA